MRLLRYFYFLLLGLYVTATPLNTVATMPHLYRTARPVHYSAQ